MVETVSRWEPPGEVLRRGDARVRHATRSEVAAMIEEGHYLHRWPAIVRCIVVMERSGVVVGVVVFADAPKQTSRRFGLYTWELARLWIGDEQPHNSETWLIAQAVRHVRNEHAEVGSLVSYADPAAGHDGQIYRASNWRWDGDTQAGRKPRTDYASASGSIVSRRGRVKGPVVPVERSNKLRFWMKLRPDTLALKDPPRRQRFS